MLIKLSKQQCFSLFKRIIKCIKKSKKGFFIFKKMRGVHGICDWDRGIFIDYRKELVNTVIHECLHYIEPNWSEVQILYAEKRIVNCLTKKQIILLLKNFLKKIK